jgi:hypothetical protein
MFRLVYLADSRWCSYIYLGARHRLVLLYMYNDYRKPGGNYNIYSYRCKIWLQ